MKTYVVNIEKFRIDIVNDWPRPKKRKTFKFSLDLLNFIIVLSLDTLI